ncbi:hypothetical protein SAMN05421688_1089 [Poseidonocella pacifica]|uniref:Uncharacterized protein n=1 Tax=Poseidonocella pacifica TaxID=871651 RepID=A0A1I0W848_9RHOB|nr:hypothetical protein [Poseidonocella pacifica]SFA84450.1 hypothetical protein SAMN05421688_1089 [Poseidonocella pacifica]
MKTTFAHGAMIDDLATAAVCLGRQFHKDAHAIHLGGNSRDFGFVERTLCRLAERDPFDPRDDASLEALKGILEADLRSEVIKVERRFFETHYDASGQHGEVRDCPVYSERGEALLAVQTTFEQFLSARAQTLDRVAAERALQRLFAS